MQGKTIVHLDRGAHYRWPGWLTRISEAKLVRSMSRKGCSQDNAACEGFFGWLKTELFYPRDWRAITIEQLVAEVDAYIRWYSESALDDYWSSLDRDVTKFLDKDQARRIFLAGCRHVANPKMSDYRFQAGRWRVTVKAPNVMEARIQAIRTLTGEHTGSAPCLPTAAGVSLRYRFPHDTTAAQGLSRRYGRHRMHTL